ncbi:prepilin-type N-terminal cleavage/methylation domain-containing protein [Acetobacterium wieringae]|uniref:type IV pilus modification PilV family protein n=1 Tax=Acetobacterium wieringae TaxID=52694 RepID=UPI0026EE24C6|nr:prepilin-type N-terminal cleavage/methylation domain-containing protein [Acetobacterium wieringae]
MNKILKNNDGITLIETVVSTAIIMIILVSVVGALMYGQKMIVFTDSKNNAAAIGQDQIDKMIAAFEAGETPGSYPDLIDGHAVDIVVNSNVIDEKTVYNISIRVYYNSGDSYVDLVALAKYYNNKNKDKPFSEGGDFV